MLDAGVQEAEKNFAALVIGTEAPDFSVGANLMLVLLEAQEGNWDEIDLMVRTLQRTTQALRHANVPVVVSLRHDARRRLRDPAAWRSRAGGR